MNPETLLTQRPLGHHGSSCQVVAFCARSVLLLLLLSQVVFGQRTVRVGVFPNHPALFIHDGKPSGFFKDLTDEIARRNDWQIEYVPGSLAESIERIRTGELDLLPCTSPSDARREYMDFGEEPVYTGWGQVYAAPGVRIESVLDIAGKRLAFVEGNNTAGFFANMLAQFNVSYTPVPCREPPEVFKALESGTADVGTVNNIFGNAVRDQYHARETNILFHPFKLYYVVPKGKNPELLTAVDRFVGEAKEDQRSIYHELIDRWFTGATPGGFNGRTLFVAVGILLLLLTVASAVALLFRLQVRRAVRQLALANTELRVSQERLRATLQSIGDGVIATDLQGVITQINPAAEKLTGWLGGSALGQPLEVILLTADHVDTPQAHAARQFPFDTTDVGRQNILIDKNGTSRTIARRGAPIRDSQGKVCGTVLVFRDITDEMAMQERYRQSQRMDVVGQLAGGIAHDFNNMLGGIMGCSELLLLEIPPESASHSKVITILEAARRAADLTRKLLLFSRKGSVSWQSLDIHDTIRSALELLGRSIDRRIDITTDFRARPSIISGDAALLENVILNLAINARDAMPHGGRLTIATGNQSLEPFSASNPQLLPPGDYVKISVSDTGEGMSHSVLSKVFDPFFTTKPAGKGTGLGLTAVYGTIKEHRGSITVHSEQGKGSIFTILLPLAREKPSAKVMPNPEATTGKGCILVVDDEPILRETTRAQLTSLGYHVREAADGEQALEIYKEDFQSISLVLLDLVMPGLGGAETFKALQSINPKVKILICSGYTSEASVPELIEQGACGFIPKPYQLSNLGSMIATALKASE